MVSEGVVGTKKDKERDHKVFQYLLKANFPEIHRVNKAILTKRNLLLQFSFKAHY